MMKPSTSLRFNGSTPGLLRAAAPVLSQLLQHLFARYPADEAVTLARFGWRDTANGLILTLHALDLPRIDDVDGGVSHVVLREPYLLRTALEAEDHPFAVGVIHSHPQGALTMPSCIDDDMDEYLAAYFGDFAPYRPYVSLILARNRSGKLAVGGRFYLGGAWHRVTRISLVGHPDVGPDYRVRSLPLAQEARVKRLVSAFGREAAARLHNGVVAVVGASGTGSPALEVLARAGVGTLIAVDPDLLDASNLERVHGSEARDVEAPLLKVDLQRRHLTAINPAINLVTICGRVPQREVLDSLVWADVVLGCTDSQSARVALSDLSKRYLVPVLDAGVALDGASGKVTAQVMQFARMLPADRCVFCREMVDPVRVTEELMPADQQSQRRAAAEAALQRGESGTPYWRGAAQLNTVGYLTTATGAIAAGYVIGWLSGGFTPPFELLQADLSQPEWGIADRSALSSPSCACQNLFGVADQGVHDALIAAPPHWAPPAVAGELGELGALAKGDLVIGAEGIRTS